MGVYALFGQGRGFDYLSIDILDLIGRYCPVFTGNYRYFPVFPARPGNKAGVREICQPCLPLSRSLQFPKYSCSDFFSFFFSPQSMHMLHGHLCMLPVATHSDLTDLPYPYPVSRDPDPWSQHGQIRDVRLN